MRVFLKKTTRRYADNTIMKLSILSRKLHSWGAIVVALPVLLIVATGILLQIKKQSPWVQPPEQNRGATVPAVRFSRILDQCGKVEEAEIRSWDDIARIDVRPSKGILKVQAKNSWEIQLDSVSGDILQVRYRRSDLIESLHDGSWFSEIVKLGVFLPVAFGLLLLWFTGMYLFWYPRVVRWRRHRDRELPR